MAANLEGVPYTINGTKIVFPFKAYPTQLCMMDKIIKGLERRQHSLLESPTGSGKSVALLCSCLAWQKAEYDKCAKEESKEDDCNTCCGEVAGVPSDQSNASVNPVPPADCKGDVGQQSAEKIEERQKTEEQKIVTTTESKEKADKRNPSTTPLGSPTDDDFQPAKKRFRGPSNPQLSSKTARKRRIVSTSEGTVLEEEYNKDHEIPQWDMEVTSDKSKESTSSGTSDSGEIRSISPPTKSEEMKSGKKIGVPKIYFGTRTHKQVTQLIRELNKTHYKQAKMTILSSRDHSCIHPDVAKAKNKSEECGKLNDPTQGGMCGFYHRVHVMKTQQRLRHLGLHTAWDIEDLVTVGRRVQACPYYAARELVTDSEIIICPYNYLIDPLIRKQLDINLKNQVMVLDEAHNVEDCCRENASMKVTEKQLQDVLDDIDKMVSLGVLTDHHRPLHVLCANMLRLIHESSGDLKETSFEQASKVLCGDEILKTLQEYGITAATMAILQKHYAAIVKASQDTIKKNDPPSLSISSISFLQAIFLILGEYLLKHVSDYRVAIVKTATIVRANELPGNWRRAHATRKEWILSLNFWCMNPAVVFSEIGSMARSIILTSGTLSPMTTFASELGVSFPIKLEANHVVAKSQVWAGTLLVGPSGTPINASYRYSETFSFQDEVGELVLQTCKIVPHGILCFFPSYNMLEKLSRRWQATGLWSQLAKKKVVVVEPRGGGSKLAEFDDIMHQFYHAVRVSSNEEEEDSDEEEEEEHARDGGLFLAVCRGKVSEGMDFADNNARAVITIGIPFPNVKDIQVIHKRKYNNHFASSRGLLTGNEWYESQAFRALNQALGRCIRHRHDWGAILVVDERFKSPRYTNGLSKWFRSKLQSYNKFQAFVSSLAEFTKARQSDPCPTPSAQTMNSSWMDNSFTAHTPSTISNETPGPAISSLAVTPCNATFEGRLSEGSVTGLRTPAPTSLNVNIAPKVLSFDSPNCVKNGKSTRTIVGTELTRGHALHELNGSHEDVSVVDGGSSQSTVDREASTQESSVMELDGENLNLVSSTVQRVAVLECPGSPLLFTTPTSTPPSSTPSLSPREDVEKTDETLQERTAQRFSHTTNKGSSCETGVKHSLLEVTDEMAGVENQIVQDRVVKNNEKPGEFQANPEVGSPDLFRQKHSTTRSLFKKSKPAVTDSESVTLDLSLSRSKDHVEDTKADSYLPDEKMKRRSIYSEAKAELSSSNTRTRKSSRRVKQEPNDEAGGTTRVTRSNLRRSCKKSTRGATRRTNDVVDCYDKKKGKSSMEPENKVRGEHITCGRCGCLLLTGKASRQRKPVEIFQKLFGSLNAVNTGSNDEQEVLVADKSSLVSNIRTFGSSNKGLNLNSLYVPSEERCYVPQTCAQCYCADKPDSTRITGVQVISFGSQLSTDDRGATAENPTKEVWIIPNAVVQVTSQ